ncbi:MAG TPA: hypothetical protein ENL15_00300 [Firmicutes bacterium]|nr:hypothetical protein [Bacillota bacterium]
MKTNAVLFLFVAVVSLFALDGCGRAEKPEIIEMNILKSFELKDIAGGNIACTVGVYNDTLYYTRRTGDVFSIVFTDFEGNEIRHFDIPRGKGPGEAIMAMVVKVKDDIVYFYDLGLKRLSRFDLNGRFLDSIDYTPETGIIIFFAFLNDRLFIHSANNIYIGEIDPSTGRLLRSLPHPIQGMPEVGTRLIGGMMDTDPYTNEIYVGHACKPYRIERYDTDFNLLGTFTYGKDKEYEPVVYQDHLRIAGDTLVNSLAVDKDYVYAPHIGDREYVDQNNHVIRPEYPIEVYAFSKKSGKLTAIYKSSTLGVTQGTFGTAGTSDGKLVLIVSGFGHAVTSLSGGIDDPKYRGYAVVIETK